MPLTTQLAEKRQRELAPTGPTTGLVCRIVDLGTHINQFNKERNQVAITFELPDLEPIEYERDGEKLTGNRVITNTYNFVFGDKSRLTTLFKAAGLSVPDYGENASLLPLLGKYVQVSIKHEERDGKTYENIDEIASLHPSIPRTEGTLPKYTYDVKDKQNDIYQQLPEWLKKKIDGCLENASGTL